MQFYSRFAIIQRCPCILRIGSWIWISVALMAGQVPACKRHMSIFMQFYRHLGSPARCRDQVMTTLNDNPLGPWGGVEAPAVGFQLFCSILGRAQVPDSAQAGSKV